MPYFSGASGVYCGNQLSPSDVLIPSPPFAPGYDQTWNGTTWVATRRPTDLVTKLVIRNRLAAAGLTAAYRAFLTANPDAADQWNDATVIYAGDPNVRAALTAIGANADAILDYDPAAS